MTNLQGLTMQIPVLEPKEEQNYGILYSSRDLCYDPVNALQVEVGQRANERLQGRNLMKTPVLHRGL